MGSSKVGSKESWMTRRKNSESVDAAFSTDIYMTPLKFEMKLPYLKSQFRKCLGSKCRKREICRRGGDRFRVTTGDYYHYPPVR